MKGNVRQGKGRKARRYPLIFATVVAFLTVVSAGVSTFAWFQVNAEVTISASSSSTNITVSAPEDLVKFYYFKGNGLPGSDNYTGYSKQNASYGNTTNIVKSDGTFSTNAGSTSTSISVFDSAWGAIDVNSTSTASGDASKTNCFNFSKMRPGCYYSFLAETGLSSTTLAATFSWNHGSGRGTGEGTSPKRYLYSGGTTSNPLNLMMAINGYCKELPTKEADATTYIKNTVGLASGLSLTDKIAFTPSGVGATSQSFTWLNGANTSTNKYVYFTVFMGGNNDTYSYRQTAGNIEYYEQNASGTYAPLDGLKSTLTSIVAS